MEGFPPALSDPRSEIERLYAEIYQLEAELREECAEARRHQILRHLTYLNAAVGALEKQLAKEQGA